MCAGLPALAALVAVVGWVGGIEGLPSLGFDAATMQLNAALAILACAVALALQVQGRGRALTVARGLGAAAAAIGGITLAEYAFGANLSVDQLIVNDPGPASYPGRMAPNTAIALVALGVSLGLPGGRRVGPARSTLATVAAGLGYTALVGYAAGVPSFYGVGELTRMAIPTAACLALLGIGAVLAETNRSGGLLAATTRGGALVRRLLPTALLLPVALGLLRAQGEAAGLFARETGVFLFALAVVLGVALLILTFAHSLDRSDRDRESAERELHEIGERYASALRRSEERLRAIATQAPAGIYESDRDGYCRFASERWCELTGLSQEEAAGLGWVQAIHPDDRSSVFRAWEGAAGNGRDFELEYRFLRKDGSVVWVAGTATPIRDSSGAVSGYVGTCIDITAAREADAALREAEERFRSTFENAPIGMAVAGLDGRFEAVNASLAAITGYSRAELMRTGLRAITHPSDLDADEEATRLMLAGELTVHSCEKRFIHTAGAPVWVAVHVTLVRDGDGRPAHFLNQVQDVTERRRYEQQLQHMADHDPLTGLLNRRRFEEDLQRHLAGSARYGAQGAVLVLDLDQFKYYNDTLGHNAGDGLIVRVADVLRSRLRETDVLARLGGDEFAVILPRADEDGALNLADDLLAQIRQETAGADAGRRRGLSASIGVAMITDDEGATAEDVLVNADLAMYEAKGSGRDQVSFFRSGGVDQSRMKGWVKWVDSLQHALDHDGFVLLAQPIIDLATGDVARHELLLRMRSGQDDLVPPGSFLYIAERLGLVAEIDRWVITRAIDVLAEEHAAGRSPSFEVNLSGHSICDESLLEVIEARLASTGVPPESLTFEITETSAVANIGKARAFAERLSDLGAAFALDDFGAGFGSFYYLKHLPFDILKIDGEFVRNCVSNSTDRLLIDAVVTMARGLGKRTVAEFVGDAPTVEVLRGLGVDMGQGFYLGRPVPLDEMLRRAPSPA